MTQKSLQVGFCLVLVAILALAEQAKSAQEQICWDISLINQQKRGGEFCFSVLAPQAELSHPCAQLAPGGVILRHFNFKPRELIISALSDDADDTRQNLFCVMMNKARFALRFISQTPKAMVTIKLQPLQPLGDKSEPSVWLVAMADKDKLQNPKQLGDKLLDLPLIKYRDFPELRFISGSRGDQWIFANSLGQISHSLQSDKQVLSFNTGYLPHWLVFERLTLESYRDLIRLLSRLKNT